MKIYTKKGDKGQTSLFGGGPFPKNDIRVSAYGEVDELNSVIGCALSELKEEFLELNLLEIQKQLFVVGAELASIHPPEKMKEGFIREKHIKALEKIIDQCEEDLKPLTQFILPGGTKAASLLHLARTTCRRAERGLVSLSQAQDVREELITYLNRLSDALFVMARLANARAQVQDLLWEGILLK